MIQYVQKLSLEELYLMLRFTKPRDLYHGKGSIEYLKTVKGKKSGAAFERGKAKKFGFSDRVKIRSKEAGVEVKAFDDVDFLYDKIRALGKSIDISTSFQEHSVGKYEFPEGLNSRVEHALPNGSADSNPIPTKQEEMERLFLSIYNGEDINF